MSTEEILKGYINNILECSTNHVRGVYVVVWCGLEFNQNHKHTASHFCGHMCGAIYKMRFEVGILFKFWAFLTHPKTNFPFFFGQVLNYLASFSLFWVDFSSQHLLRLSNFFFLKTTVIKLLIIYLILKINKYINI